MKAICAVCGSEGGPRSYLHLAQLNTHAAVLSWFLELENDSDVEKLGILCAICMQKINNLSVALSDLRKKYVETQLLLDHYANNVVTDSWNDFTESDEAFDLLKKNSSDVEVWKLSINKFTSARMANRAVENERVDFTREKDENEHIRTEAESIDENRDLDVIETVSDSEFAREAEKTSSPSSNPPRREKVKSFYDNFVKKLDKRFYCILCEDSFKWRYLAETHVKSKHSREKYFECKICSKRFSLETSLKRHVLSIHETGRFRCQKCGRAFSRRYVLLTHEKTHSESPSIPCSHENCDKKFYSNEILNAHIANCHRAKTYICDKCGNKFRTNARLTIHRRRHEEKSLKCPNCPMAFSVMAGLRVHLKYHMNPQPWKCGACNTFFKTSKGLQNHFAISHRDKINKCEISLNTVNVEKYIAIYFKICIFQFSVAFNFRWRFFLRMKFHIITILI